MTLLDALHINNSGGKVLLDYLVAQLHASGRDVFYLLDERVKGAYSFLPEGRVEYLQAGLYTRYLFYRAQGNHFSKVLCFGNIPPPVRLSCPVYTYFHNVLYLNVSANDAWFKRTQFLIKTVILKALRANTDEWWVQTEAVRETFCHRMGVASDKVKTYPFFPDIPIPVVQAPRETNSFLFVSDANPHKNHVRLLKAFELVWADNPQTARLFLTVSKRYPDILHRIEILSQGGLPVTNLGLITREELGREYVQRAFLIYPSLVESFGLGLVEAAQAGMPILAADLPYAHAVVAPFLVFDPTNPESIAQCIQLALQKKPASSPLKIGAGIAEILHKLQ
jgi:glycosyltransferase involved in cell wall biosynthesis